MKLIRNTLVFCDTSFFKKYKPGDALYRKLFQYSQDRKVSLCTSYLCLEEWRTQKANHINSSLGKISENLVYLRKDNYLASKILEPEIHKNFPDDVSIITQSKMVAEEFIKENNIRLYPPREAHIFSTWEAYFNGRSPFKEKKNKTDIPDAWIFECAKDVLSDPPNTNTENKFCIVEDIKLCETLEEIDFEGITVLDLVERLEREEVGIEQKYETASTETTQERTGDIVTTEGLSPLDALLTNAVNVPVRGIYLRLLGFVVPLDTPSHDSLIDAVVSRGFDRKLTEACAVILSDKSKPYIKDTGSHYIVENKEICTAAAERLTPEIIDMLG